MNVTTKYNLGITGLDDMFKDEKELRESKFPKIHEIPIELIDDFPDHPFKVRDDDDMKELVDSIKERGLITPVTLLLPTTRPSGCARVPKAVNSPPRRSRRSCTKKSLIRRKRCISPCPCVNYP